MKPFLTDFLLKEKNDCVLLCFTSLEILDLGLSLNNSKPFCDNLRPSQ